MPIEDARELAALWGPDPVHPAASAYQVIVDGIVQDLSSSESRYTNPPKTLARPPGHSRVDLSLERDAWVRGCMAALPRRDSSTICGGAHGLGPSNRSRAEPHRGNRFSRGNHGVPRQLRCRCEVQPRLQAAGRPLQVAQGWTAILSVLVDSLPMIPCYTVYIFYCHQKTQ
jgi:hypothetical protein